MFILVSSTFKAQSFKADQHMIFRIEVHTWGALTELTKDTQDRGDAEQAELQLTSFFLASATHSIPSAETAIQEAALNTHVCRSPARLLQNSFIL